MRNRLNCHKGSETIAKAQINMTTTELTNQGWKPLTYPYTAMQADLLARAIAQLETGKIPYRVAPDSHEGVDGWAIYTQPKIVYNSGE